MLFLPHVQIKWLIFRETFLFEVEMSNDVKYIVSIKDSLTEQKSIKSTSIWIFSEKVNRKLDGLFTSSISGLGYEIFLLR